jgi:hypothetical protein
MITPGDIWVAEILFTDGSAAKKRSFVVGKLDGRKAYGIATLTAVSWKDLLRAIVSEGSIAAVICR